METKAPLFTPSLYFHRFWYIIVSPKLCTRFLIEYLIQLQLCDPLIRGWFQTHDQSFTNETWLMHVGFHMHARKRYTHLAALSQCCTQILLGTTETALNAFVMESFVYGLCICGCAVFAVVFNHVFIHCSSTLYRQNQCLWKFPTTNLLLTDSHLDFS